MLEHYVGWEFDPQYVGTFCWVRFWSTICWNIMLAENLIHNMLEHFVGWDFDPQYVVTTDVLYICLCTMDLQCSEITPQYCTTEFHTIVKLLPTDKVWLLSVHKGIYKRNKKITISITFQTTCRIQYQITWVWCFLSIPHNNNKKASHSSFPPQRIILNRKGH